MEIVLLIIGIIIGTVVGYLAADRKSAAPVSYTHLTLPTT